MLKDLDDMVNSAQKTHRKAIYKTLLINCAGLMTYDENKQNSDTKGMDTFRN
jgi:hypothetical protein